MAVQVDPAVLRHAEPARGRDRHQQHRSTLVDLVARDQEARVGVDDRAVALARGGQLRRRARRRGGGERVAGGHLAEGCEQLAHADGVLLATEAEPSATGVLEERVLDRGVDQAVDGGVPRDQAAQADAAVLQAPADLLGEVGRGLAPGEVTRGRDGLRPGHQDDLALAGGDRGRHLRDQPLRCLAADDLEDRVRRVGADPRRHRPREVVGPAERSLRDRGGRLELTHPGDGVDRGREVVGRRTRVGQGVRRRASREVGRRETLVAGVVDALRALADADEHGCPGVEVAAVHGATVAATANAPAVRPGTAPAPAPAADRPPTRRAGRAGSWRSRRPRSTGRPSSQAVK